MEVSEPAKAIMLTAFVKMCRHDSSLVPLARKVFSEYTNHWNVELYARACEYSKMLDLLDESQTQTSLVDVSNNNEEGIGKELVLGALEKMPNFSEEI